MKEALDQIGLVPVHMSPAYRRRAREHLLQAKGDHFHFAVDAGPHSMIFGGDFLITGNTLARA